MGWGRGACGAAVLAAGLVLAAGGCGTKGPPVNEKVSKEVSGQIVPGKTTVAEVEALLGPGEEFSDPKLVAGFSSKRWGPGRADDRIEVVYDRSGKVVEQVYSVRSPAK